ncbi:sensory histidine kinase AtoS [Halolamina pelagica]|uniref:histidine kinase n=1 Tax=Halolamina pelagica TaxID=699431 RepID=A0A0P7GBR8_9EURY|nr:histidine kinase N-terminal 7TM domain-containing protein [Halolamina pelagica]KPN31241.1 sensory histidine kinase AtoS [Halolamina pelagica]
MQYTLGVGLATATAIITTLTAAFLLNRSRSAETVSLVGFNVAVAVWTGGNALQVASTTLTGKLFWVNVQYVGIALLPVSIFAFAVYLSGADDRVTRTHLGLLAVPMAALALLSWTNGVHGLVRTSVGLAVVDGVVVLERTFGPAFWLGWVYSNLLNLTATVLVLRSVVYADRIIERRVLALLIGPLVPWVAQFLYLTGAHSIEPETFFAFTAVAFAYAEYSWDSIESAQSRDAVLELLEEGVLVVASDGRVVDLNSATRELLALGDAVAVGEPIDDVLDDYPTLLEAYREGEATTDLTIDAGQTRRHVDVQFSSFAGNVGNPDKVVVLTDVTAIREQERALERQNERLESFASMVSHDLRNPLNVAQGRVELAEAECDSEHLQIAQRAHNRMAGLIDDILTLARQGQSVESVEPVDLGSLARATWEMVETPEASLEVETDLVIRADRSRLQQLLENLFRNAVEHNDPGVTVTLGRSPDGFYVADDGTGIPPDERDDVFEAGYSTRDRGPDWASTS